jgi:plastocyanin
MKAIVRACSPLALLPLLLPFLPAAPAGAAELTGRVDLVSNGSRVPGAAGRAVVYYVPDRSNGPARSAGSARQRMTTQGKEFQPRVLVVPEGGSVAFPNLDPILHNVFSVSEAARFDLGLYGRGESKDVRFEEAGVVRIFCNVHHDMVGYVLVVDTPHHASPDGQGTFRLLDLPPGRGTLTVWHEQTDTWSRRVDVPETGGSPLTIRMELSKPLIPPHLDKSGRSYRQRRRDRYRGRED